MMKHLSVVGWWPRMLSVAVVLVCVTAPRPVAAQEAPAPPPPAERPLRAYAYGGYTFTSIIHHGGTVAIVLSKARDTGSRNEWAKGLQVTTSIGQNGYVVGGGWAMCSRENLPGCVDIRGIVGRTRTATEKLNPKEWYAGAEGGVVFLVFRFSAGLAFPLGESGSRTPMFFGAIGFTPPVFNWKWFK
jgi:hypothetical protein